MNDLEIKKVRKKLKMSQTELARLLGVSLRTIQNWEAGENIPLTKHEILRNFIDQEGAIREKQNKGIPLIDVGAAVSLKNVKNPEIEVMELDNQQFVIPVFNGADFLVRVNGSSMYPKYNSGDIVACKKLVCDDVFFQWNKVYVIDTEQGTLIKRVDIAPDDDYIMIVSDNESYKPFLLHKSKINAVSIVMGVIRLE
jgi:DNA-binding XRE family transcriptional regulator